MINFLEETLESMNYYEKTEEDVLFCEMSKQKPFEFIDGKFVKQTFQFSFEDFKKNANFVYDNGFGGEEFDPSLDINSSIVIVFKDGSWFERSYYDGSEWWDYKKCPSFKGMSNDFDIHLRNFPM
jgi:hypothetical protein